MSVLKYLVASVGGMTGNVYSERMIVVRVYIYIIPVLILDFLALGYLLILRIEIATGTLQVIELTRHPQLITGY
jgi:hypothetical protein